MRTAIALSLLLATLVASAAADGVKITGNIEGKELNLEPDTQTKLIDATTKLLATCSKVVVEPIGRLENARLRSNVEFVFTPPRKFDLGLEKKPGTTAVEVQDMVITLPVCSGRVWIDTTQFRWVCSGFDTNICRNLDGLLGIGRKR